MPSKVLSLDYLVYLASTIPIYISNSSPMLDKENKEILLSVLLVKKMPLELI